jgi:hypothetical protein
MNAYNSEDGRKYNYALLARDIRRLTATIQRANIDDDTREMIDAALEQLESRVWLFSFHDPASDVFVHDQNTYLDGRPVTTTLNWGRGIRHPRALPRPAGGQRKRGWGRGTGRGTVAGRTSRRPPRCATRTEAI